MFLNSRYCQYFPDISDKIDLVLPISATLKRSADTEIASEILHIACKYTLNVSKWDWDYTRNFIRVYAHICKCLLDYLNY